MRWPWQKKKSDVSIGVGMTGPSGGTLGGKSGRVNDWPKCTTCYHRAPKGAIHALCGRAAHYLSVPVPSTHLGGSACCEFCSVCNICLDRGHQTCSVCGRCVLECPGVCGECGNCRDKCKGHEKEGTD